MSAALESSGLSCRAGSRSTATVRPGVVFDSRRAADRVGGVSKLQSLRALRRRGVGARLGHGVVDMVHTACAFYAATVPECDAVSASTIDGNIARKSGAYDAKKQAHLRRMGVFYLGRMDSGIRFHLWSSRPPELDAQGDLECQGPGRAAHQGIRRARQARHEGRVAVCRRRQEVHRWRTRGLVCAHRDRLHDTALWFAAVRDAGRGAARDLDDGCLQGGDAVHRVFLAADPDDRIPAALGHLVASVRTPVSAEYDGFAARPSQ